MNYLPETDPKTLESLLQKYGVLRPNQRLVSISKAGEGNMNYVLRLKWSEGSCILKQAPPFAAKYPSVPAPQKRILQEANFYECTRQNPAVAELFPEIYFIDEDHFLLCLQDFGDARDFTFLYAGEQLSSQELLLLGETLAAIHSTPRSLLELVSGNHAMRRLNHAHIFDLPLSEDGLDLSGVEGVPLIKAQQLKKNSAYRKAVEQLGKRYLSQTEGSLLHGDFYPGSWLQVEAENIQELRMIDPEFSFVGDPEFDLGVCLAHFVLSSQHEASIFELLETYQSKGCRYDPSLLCRYIAVEIMRRIIGLAQLPLRSEQAARHALLELSEELMLKQDLKALMQ